MSIRKEAGTQKSEVRMAGAPLSNTAPATSIQHLVHHDPKGMPQLCDAHSGSEQDLPHLRLRVSTAKVVGGRRGPVSYPAFSPSSDLLIGINPG
jgi:hypothetical protein